MKKPRILVVEDDEDIRELETFTLRKDGLDVAVAASGEEALRLVKAQPADQPIDLVLLDLMLPSIDGLEVCRRLRADPDLRAVPIVMVTARGEEADVVVGLELGADDYIRKPFKPRELVARIKTVLRRAARQPVTRLSDETLTVGEVEIVPGRREVKVRGRPVELTFTEFEILRLLAGRPGWVFTRYQIVDRVRGGDYPVTDRAVDVQIVGLRRKLGRAGDSIETVRGIGYRFRDPDAT